MEDIKFEKIMLRDMQKNVKQGNLKNTKAYFIDSLLTQNEIYNDLEHNINEAFMSACYHGHLEIVRYVLTSPELYIHANIHYKDDSAIFNAVDGCNTEVINYLLNSPELKEHIDLYKNIDEIFDELMKELYVENKNYYPPGDANAFSINDHTIDVMNYLIYDYKIFPTEHIIQLLKNETKIHYYEPAIEKLNSNLYHYLEEKIDKNNDKKINKVKI